jgi:hypothetical protein
MLNEVIDSKNVRAQKAAHSTQSSGSSFVYHRSKDELKIIRLKEAMRQQEEYYSAYLGDASDKLSDFIITIEHLGIFFVLIICITTCIAYDTTTRI